MTIPNPTEPGSCSAPIFGLGYMRSGTTLIFNVLRNHPEVFSQEGEPKFFKYLPSIQKAYPFLESHDQRSGLVAFVANSARFGHPLDHLGKPLIESSDFSARDLKDVLSRLSQPFDYTDVFVKVWNQITTRRGKTRWFAKTQPFYARFISEKIPDALFTNIVRDPRDVLASKKSAKKAVWSSDRYQPEIRAHKGRVLAYHPVWDAISWRSEVRSARQFSEQYPDRYRCFTYETLVGNPEDEFREMLAFLGLSFPTGILTVSKNSSHSSERESIGINQGSIGRWKSNLSDSEVALIQWLAHSEMKSYGYEPTESSTQSRFFAVRYLLSAAPTLMKVLIDRYRLGGSALVSSVLKNYVERIRALR